jgi:hypothetical protein
MNSDPHRLHHLFGAHSDGTITPEEHAELQERLRNDPAARRLWFVHQDVDSGLHGLAHAMEQPRSNATAGGKWFNWRPLTAAAAGLIIGLSSASFVYGLVTPRQVKTQSVLTESFEDEDIPLDRGVPRRMEVWSGDLQTPQSTEGEVKPAEGLRMASLPPVERKKFSYAFRFLDMDKLPPMAASETRQLEVTAQFHSAVPGMRDRFQIRLAVFAEDIAGAREIWVSDQLDEQALLHVAKTVKRDAAHGWTTVRSMIDVPAGARAVLVSLAAGTADNEAQKTEHFLDDVQIRLFTHEALP